MQRNINKEAVSTSSSDIMKYIKKGENLWIILQKEEKATGQISFNWDGENSSPILIIANEYIRDNIQTDALDQAFSAKEIFGTRDVILTPDVHLGNFIPTGCVLTASNHIFPGSIGDDIGCGMRLIKTNLTKDQLNIDILRDIIQKIDLSIPTGFNHNPSPLISRDKLINLLIGVFHTDENDIREHPPYHCDGQFLSEKHLIEAEETLGTLGGGNHFIEIQTVDKIFNPEIAEKWGIFKNQLLIMIHSGSRSLGAMIAFENITKINQFFSNWGIQIPKKDAIYCPENSDLGEEYINEMRVALNFSIENRSFMAKKVIEVFKNVFADVYCDTLYDICHNTITQETIYKDKYWIHRKGATRAFPANHQFLKNTLWCKTGHPVLLPGSMGSKSYIMRGLDNKASGSAYYSINHGAGRKMGRKQALREISDAAAIESLGHVLTNHSEIISIKDEVPLVYKDINEIIDSVEGSGIAESIVALSPVGVVKGANR